LNFHECKDKLVKEAIANLAVKVHDYKSRHRKKTIVVTGCGAENGTSTIATGLAAALAGADCRTLLVDADLRKHSDTTTDKGLSDAICHGYEINSIIKLTNIDGMHFMSSGIYTKEPANLFCSPKTTEFIATAAAAYDFVIFDSPAVTVVPDAMALFQVVDGIILVCALDKTRKGQLQAAKDMIEPYADKYYGLVVNFVDKRQYKHMFPDYRHYSRKDTKQKKKQKKDDK